MRGLLYNKKNGHYVWQFVYTDPKTGKKSRLHFASKIFDDKGNVVFASNEDEAIEARVLYINNGRNPIDKMSLQKDRVTLSEFIEMYRDYNISVAKKGYQKIDDYCNYFLNFIAYHYYKGDLEKAKLLVYINEVDTMDFIRYRRKRQQDEVMVKCKDGVKSTGRKITNSTINREVNSIQGMFSYALNIVKIITTHPCKNLTPLPIKQIIKNPLSEEQETKLIEMAKEKDYDLYVMIVMMEVFGNRKGEVYNLKWKHVNLSSSNIFHFGYIDFVERKNGKSLRLPLSQNLLQLLKAIPKKSEYVFTNPRTGTCYKDRGKSIDTLLKAVGAKKLGVGHHIFRASAATFSENNGAETSALRELLGQSDVNSLDPYLNQGVKRLQEIINLNSERIRNNENNHTKYENAQKMPKSNISCRRFKIIRNLETIEKRV